MDEHQVSRAEERVQVMAEAVGLPLPDERVPDLALALDAARLMIAQVEPLAARVDVPVNAPFNPAWPEGRDR